MIFLCLSNRRKKNIFLWNCIADHLWQRFTRKTVKFRRKLTSYVSSKPWGKVFSSKSHLQTVKFDPKHALTLREIFSSNFHEWSSTIVIYDFTRETWKFHRKRVPRCNQRKARFFHKNPALQFKNGTSYFPTVVNRNGSIIKFQPRVREPRFLKRLNELWNGEFWS